MFFPPEIFTDLKIARRILAGWMVAACLCALAEPVNPKIIERYKQMLAARPVEGTALDRLWQAALEQNQTTELIAEYRDAGTFASEMVLGHLLRKAARLPEAAAAFERAAALDEKSPLPWLALAHLHSEAGAKKAAAEALEKAALVLPEKDAQTVEVLLQLGAAWLAAGDSVKATEAWERTVAIDPSNLDLRRKLAAACIENHIPDRAIAHLEYVEKNAPPQDRAQALQQLSRIHQAAGHQDAAIGALERALSYTAPGNWLRAELQSQIVRLHQRYHRVVELEERWKVNVRDNPRDIAGYLQLVDLYERTGELDRQREWLQKLVAIAPKTAEYRLKLARLLVHTDDLDGAVALYDPLLKERLGDVDLVFERARLDIQRDNMDAARARIAALVAAVKNNEAVRGKALEFYEANRLNDLVEAHLKTDAAGGAEEPLLALVNFYFAQHREADAMAALQRLVVAGAPKESQAVGLMKQAQILKTQGLLPAAADALRRAVPLAAHSREMWLLLGEIEAALGHAAPARTAYEQALAASASASERIDADQKLFESFRGEPEKTPGSRISVTGPGVIVESTEPNSSVQSYLLGLTRAAQQSPSVDGWLRVARWHLWSRSQRLAAEYAQKALAIDPNSLAAHEFMVQLGTAEPRGSEALVHLAELRRLDPSHAPEYLRREGQIELQAGHIADAERIFSELAKSTPGNTDALVDLALTQQRGEAWEKALATWQQVYALSPASRKKETIGMLLRVFDKLERHREAAALLLAHLDELGDEKEQFATFQDLLNLCSKHELVDWLRTEMELRRKARADDYFTEVALGRILKLTGNKAAAFEVLADASFAAPNQAAALPDLVREAEELRKLDAAIRLQSQLVRILPEQGIEPLAKLAQLQEKNSDIEGAAKTWEKIVAKFSRDAAAIDQAVDFQTRWGSPVRAAELLRRLRVLDPANVRALTELARLDIEAGQGDEARQCLEQVLARSTPLDPAEPLRIPGVKIEDMGRLQSTYLTTVRSRRGRPATEVMRTLRSFWAEDATPGHGDRDARLNAIRDLGKLLQSKNDAVSMKAWVKRWRDPKIAPTETLWALFHAGASGPLLDQVDAMLAASPEDAQLKQGFIWLALQTGEFDRLSAWVQDKRRTPVERDYLYIALGEHLQSHPGRIEPGLIDKLFPPGYRLRAWQAATLFANRGNYREAVQIGARVFETLTTQRAGYGVELAHWHLYLGETDAARSILRDSIGACAESFDAPVYTALREYFLLLPESERAVFSESFEQTLDETKSPLHATLARALLSALGGYEKDARMHLLRLLDLGAMEHPDDEEGGSSAARHWDFVLTTGLQLQLWKLDELAAFFWNSALADDALIRLQSQTQGEQVTAKTGDIRARLAALQLQQSGPLDAAEIIEKFQRRAGPERLNQLAEILETAGAYAQAIAVHRAAWEREPSNPMLLRDLTASCRAGNDNETLEEVLARIVREGLFRANEAVHRDLAMQLADLLARRGAYSQARVVMSETIDSATTDSRMLQRMAQLHERAGHLSDAEVAYRRAMQAEPSNAQVRLALAGVLEAQARVPAAIEMLEKSPGIDVDPKLASLYFKAGRLEDALGAIERIAPPNHLPAALAVANGLVEKGDFAQAKALLRQAIARNPDQRANLPLQSRLIEVLQPVEDRAAVPHEMQRLRRIAGEQPELLGAYYDVLLRESARLKYDANIPRELGEDWDDGAGVPSAGVALLDWQLRKEDRAGAEATWARLLARDDIGEPLWLKAREIFDKAPLPELAAQACGRIARLTPLNYVRMFEWVRALHAIGRDTEALAVLDEVSHRAVLNDEIAGQAAKLYAEFQQPAKARALFAQAVAGDPSGRAYRVHLDYAQTLLAQGDAAGARRQMRAAFRNPLNREFGELIAFIGQSGGLGDFDAQIGTFDLRPQMLVAARRALFTHFEKAGDAAGATALMDEHPEIMEPGLSGRLRALAVASGAFEKMAALFERIVAQSPIESVEPVAELAALYGEWAWSDLADAREDDALAHAKRGHELKPDLFAPMQRLAELLLKRGDPANAARAVQDFLTTSNNAAEKEKAQEILTRIER